MYTKEQLRELRDKLITRAQNAEFAFEAHGRTANFIKEMLSLYNDPDELEEKMQEFRKSQHDLPNDYTIDYRLAYDLIFGDYEVTPLYVNTVLDTIVVWRLGHTKEISERVSQC